MNFIEAATHRDNLFTLEKKIKELDVATRCNRKFTFRLLVSSLINFIYISKGTKGKKQSKRSLSPNLSRRFQIMSCSPAPPVCEIEYFYQYYFSEYSNLSM